MPVEKICRSCTKKFTAYRNRTITCGKSCAAKYGVGTKKLKGSNLGGGLRSGVERSKSGFYSGIYCSSTYELVFLIYHLDHGHVVTRSTLSLPYVYNGKKHQYHPDFDVDGVVYEIKGWLSDQDKTKAACYPEIVLVQDIKPFLNYVLQKTGLSRKQLVTLYSDRDKFELKCGFCQSSFYSVNKEAQYCCRYCSGKGNIQIARMSQKA